MTLDDAIRARRSVRGYLPHQVPEATIREVFALAQWSPSNCNIQPWVPHVVSGEGLRALGHAMTAAAREGLPQAPDFEARFSYTGPYRERQIDAARRLYGAMGVSRDDRAGRDAAYLRNLDAFGAPHAVFVFMHEPFAAREATDIGMWAQTLMLLLAARGIGSCAQGALGLYAPIVREHLRLDATHRLMMGIAFGYEDPAVAANAARTARVPLDDAVVFHRDVPRVA
jgi:nitroreductase